MDKKGHKWTMVDTLYWLGTVLVSGGVALSNVSAGAVAAGIFCLVGAFLVDRGTGGGDGK